MKFRDILGQELLFFDGAIGTELQKVGLAVGELPEVWNITHPEEVIKIHRSYLEVGANIMTTNSFGANRLKYPVGGEYELDEIVTAAVRNAKQALAGYDKAFVALNIGPTGKLLAPYGDLPFETAVELFAETVRLGTAAGADVILIETMSDIYEAKAAILACKENSDLPIICSFSYDESGKLLTGGDVVSAAITASSLGVDVVGANCGVGPEQMFKIVPQMLASCNCPLMLNPNAGLPVTRAGKTVFELTPEDFAAQMLQLVKLGLSIVGGCCGTTPAHIQALTRACQTCEAGGSRHNALTAVTSYGQTVMLGTEPVVIGERLNPTGKPRLKEAIKEQNWDYLCRLGLEQLEQGAQVLDVNVGVPGTDEPANIVSALTALQAITAAPLQIDTSNYEAMAQALRIYNGKPLLNSVNGKEESLTKVLPLAKKYGAAVVALALDDSGIPDTAAGRIAIADKIIARAAAYGIAPQDIIVDPLALTISTGGQNAQIDLAVIRELTERGIKTIMGVSNISFGLPSREAVNSTFFALALNSGLSCGIINPNSKNMMDTLVAYRALAGLDNGCQEYVQYFAQNQDVAPSPSKTAEKEYSLQEAITKGLTEQSRAAVSQLLTTTAPLTIINQHIIPALNLVGEGFAQKTLYLPQLLMSADSAKAAFDVIRAAFGSKADDKGETVVLATVRGDIHDIGKNIVKVLLENYGYRVVDLGKDVAPELIVAAAHRHQAKIVGLSALMTTTVGAMEETIAQLRQHTQTKVLVGGAVLTADYARQIGADGYAATAVDAVNYVNEN